MFPWVIKLSHKMINSTEAIKNLAESVLQLKEKHQKVVLVISKDESSSVACTFREFQITFEIIQIEDLNSINSFAISNHFTSLNSVVLIEVSSFDTLGDRVASSLASILGAKILIFASEERGILDLNELPYDSLTLDQLRILMNKGGITNGMLQKSRCIESALINGVKKVLVAHALEIKDLIENKSTGTICVEMGRLDSVMKLKGGESMYAVL